MAVSKIIGHRGASGHAPENTSAAFHKAAELGVEWVELDVKLTSDNVLVVHHDDDLSRTCHLDKEVKDVPWEELKSLDAGSFFAADFSKEHILSFVETMGLLEKLGLNANVEIKACVGREEETVQVMVDLLKKQWPEKLAKPVISSFCDKSLKLSKQMLPDFEHAMLFDRNVPDNWLEITKNTGADSIHVYAQSLTEERAKAMRDAGYPLRSYTVNDPSLGEKLFDWGVSSIFTDYPDRF